MFSAKRLFAVVACLCLPGGAGVVARGVSAGSGPASSTHFSGAQRTRHRAARRVVRRRSVKKVDVKDVKQAARVEAGVWGSRGVRLSVNEGGARIEYDCAHGEIAGALELDAEGRFTLTGTHTPERGGPVRVDEKPNTHPARYEGRVAGATMTLTVTLTDTGEQVGTFTLTRGTEGRLFKCL